MPKPSRRLSILVSLTDNGMLRPDDPPSIEEIQTLFKHVFTKFGPGEIDDIEVERVTLIPEKE